ncbi:hypothetical protein JQ559_10295 [Bradyrhizobium viridifuturi]|jgi:hypothetical protein|uniref:hypothetical protein n=1 Tax=Bradyrhizobium TaxID=374 RepID=UPI0003983821|nr:MULTISPECIES: hypothetical protein [Bradyrhizobium]ERF85259.1 MAG: ABC transporter subfamily F, uup [Bradyrhizobium sp. DFCI-1]OYU63308.1 MAG: hypothetical protein CFE30_06300 [Bradyrhizobium sp. PARBB1]PSO28402.1 hypothetical protein C7G43_04415 [Bradyrhizobium sp. MOS004]QRI72779.1 hypothetical protein JQ507_15465 [Bradyrhizobium sp. PSBB068]MBR1020993.1 hypothetical protein [Bradyrhizobium viridifuturi]
MRKTVLLMALMTVGLGTPQLGTSLAWAQQQGGSSSMQKNSGVPDAPVGHRQPRRGDVGNEKNISDPNSQANKEDAALDKKIKSICRGC